MRKIAKAAALTFAVGALASIGVTGANAAQTQASSHGCPSGAVCLYPENAGWNNDRPSHTFHSYGAHNIQGQTGKHFLFNNQTGGATARTCTGANGTGDCQGHLPANAYLEKDMTPINSIMLVKP
ncbi:hypothetical protein [Streptomyces sp. HNM0574]|uniref:hypothetical protein n=1 Tax=Streptomyces sp. HNM0574 TaxID=2714954 RepID=UPI00146BD892|nr:hypothetical protein [Streptomyces sp. HNM0574]NLU70347.1 hypothetical protein [Streptomyces sp. HNM0574]